MILYTRLTNVNIEFNEKLQQFCITEKDAGLKLAGFNYAREMCYKLLKETK